MTPYLLLLSVYFSVYNIIEQVFVGLFFQPFDKINATGQASVESGKARERIGVTNLRQMKLCQMKFCKWSFTKVCQMKFPF